MATDYDAPRKSDDDNESLEALKERSPEKTAGTTDVDETDVDGFGVQEVAIPEELEVIVLPPQEDEFTCTECFIVKHRSQLGQKRKGKNVCQECEG